MHAITTPLPEVGAPFSWATESDGQIYTAQVPIHSDGRIESGDIAAQTALTLDNLAATMRAAGGSLADVTQVIVYLTELEDAPRMNEVYATRFAAPHPNRATLIVKALALPGARIEIVAHAHVRARPDQALP